MNRLPKYWVVENHPEVLEYLIKTYDFPYEPEWNHYTYIGYTGCGNNNGAQGTIDLCMFKNNPTVLTIQEFIELSKEVEDEFVLPDKWLVRPLNNYQVQVLTKWRKGEHYGKLFEVCMTSDKVWWSYDAVFVTNLKEYKEITFEQFQKYVLKQSCMEKEIIGYNLINSKFENAALALCVIGNKFGRPLGLKADVLNKENINALKEAGVLDIWFEPVYDSLIPDITIKGYKGEFFDDYVKFGCAEIESKFFVDIYEGLIKNKSEFYPKTNKDIKAVTIGKGIFSVEQIKQIAEYYINKK